MLIRVITFVGCFRVTPRGHGNLRYDEWTMKLKSAERMDMPTMQLGGHVAELRKFVVSVKNRRQKVHLEAAPCRMIPARPQPEK